MTDSNGGKRRVTLKRSHPNPEIHELLLSLREEAVKVNSALLPNLDETIKSFAKYPLPITSGAGCAIIKGFNQRLCAYVEARLNEIKKKKVCGESSKKQGNSENNTNKYSDSNNLDIEKAMSSSSKKCKNKNHPTHKSCETDNNNAKIETRPAPTLNVKEQSVNLTTSISKGKKGKEKNNNIKKSKSANGQTSVALHINIENSHKSEIHLNCDSPILQYNDFKDPSELLGKWDSIPNKSPKHKPSKNYVDLTTLVPLKVNDAPRTGHQEKKLNKADSSISDDTPCINILTYDMATNTESWTSCNTKSGNITHKSNEDLEKLKNCAHNNLCDQTASLCEQCSNITLAANEFETSFKEKMKKDKEEVDQCVLPRKFYLPGYRTPSYALLMALNEQRNECPYRISLTKEELIQKAQKHTDQSFTKPEIDSFHTAWTHFTKLVIKGMIEIDNSSGEEYYKLTAIGRAVVSELLKEDAYLLRNEENPSHVYNDRVPTYETIVIAPSPIVPLDEGENSEPLFIEMPPGTFDIVLLIDKHEQFEPSKLLKCKFELRTLTIGDFLWVARSKKTGQELVLPFIIERKRMDDLASSIKDGRFHEQKFRLRKSGVENVIYLIESHGKNKHVGLPMPTLKQAMVNTRVQDDFMMVKTESLNHTFHFLSKMSDRLVHNFLAKHIRGCNRDTQGKELMTFEYFNKSSLKNKPLTVKETFIKMLLQLKGLSVEKALAITNQYPSPLALMKAYDRCSQKEGELLLAGLKYNSFSRNVGPAVSKTIYQLFSKLQL